MNSVPVQVHKLCRLPRRLQPDPDAEERQKAEQEATIEEPLKLNDLRLQAVVSALEETGAARVVDLGSGEGKLLRELSREKQFQEIVGMDVSYRSLEVASRPKTL